MVILLYFGSINCVEDQRLIQNCRNAEEIHFQTIVSRVKTHSEVGLNKIKDDFESYRAQEEEALEGINISFHASLSFI